jgi:hypothetical protein
LESEHGTVVEVVDLKTDEATDQIVRVRFSVRTWNRLPKTTRDRVTEIQKILQRVSYPWPYCKLKTIGAEAWIFGGDLT